jgi:hypothetical protein
MASEVTLYISPQLIERPLSKYSLRGSGKAQLDFALVVVGSPGIATD